MKQKLRGSISSQGQTLPGQWEYSSFSCCLRAIYLPSPFNPHDLRITWTLSAWLLTSNTSCGEVEDGLWPGPFSATDCSALCAPRLVTAPEDTTPTCSGNSDNSPGPRFAIYISCGPHRFPIFPSGSLVWRPAQTSFLGPYLLLDSKLLSPHLSPASKNTHVSSVSHCGKLHIGPTVGPWLPREGGHRQVFN